MPFHVIVNNFITVLNLIMGRGQDQGAPAGDAPQAGAADRAGSGPNVNNEQLRTADDDAQPMTLDDDDIWACEQCDYKASQRGHLLAHIKSTHEGFKFPCEQCDYKASKKENLLRHTKSTHEGLQYPCEQCEYKAAQKGSLMTWASGGNLHYAS